MSYLDVPRLHFSGDVRTDPSTVNNVVGSCCDPGSSDPPGDCRYNLAATIPGPGPNNWNPDGKHHFVLQNVTVKRSLDATGAVKTRPDQDPLIGGAVTNGLARLVDLDPMWQTASQVWGLELTVSDSRGSGFVATMTTATLRDLWGARAPGGFSRGLGGVYQSVLTNVRWNPDVGPLASPVLGALRAGSPSRLSIRFVVYAYDSDAGSPRGSNATFTVAHIVGTIGPAPAGEPDHVPNARGLINSVPAAAGSRPFGSAPFKVDAARGKVVIDLGNAVPEGPPPGERLALGTFRAEIAMTPPTPAVALGTIQYDRTHYLETAGIEEVSINAAQATQLATRPLRIKADLAPGPRLVLAERADGVMVDASEWVGRLNPGESLDIDLIATKFGAAAAGIDVNLAVLQGLPLAGLSLASVAGAAATSLALSGAPPSVRVRTAASGRATVRFTASSPGHPRLHMDGQVYVFGYFVGPIATANLRGMIAIRVFEAKAVPASPHWSDVQDILTQYARLYPSMTAVIDLSNEALVRGTAGALAAALRRAETAANYMPVTRDLSRDRKALLLKWLDAGAPH
jgi:hypothetical protein